MKQSHLTKPAPPWSRASLRGYSSRRATLLAGHFSSVCTVDASLVEAPHVVVELCGERDEG